VHTRLSRLYKTVSILCIIIFISFLPLFVGDYLILVSILIIFNVLLASSLRVSLNVGQLNLGIPAFFAIGAYSSALMTLKMGIPFLLAFFTSGLFAAIASSVIGYASLRLKGVYFLMITLAVVEIVRVSLTSWEPLTGGAVGIHNIPLINIFGFELNTKVSQYYFILFVALVILFILFKLEYSRFGLTLKSIRQSEDLARATGINTFRYKILAFSLCSFFCGLTGSLYAHMMTFIEPNICTFIAATMVMIYCFVGGLRGFAGPIVGAVTLSLLTEPLRGLKNYEMIFFAIILILVVLFLPGGLISLPNIFLSRFRRFTLHK
jgi:branched-chain amino acid transport system permease protein